MESSTYTKNRNLTRKQLGLCQSCPNQTNGTTKCEQCKQKQRQLRAKRAADGVCNKCGKHPAKPGIKWCETCTEKAKVYNKKVEDRHKQLGLCYHCNTPTSGKTRCSNCAVQTRLTQKRLKENRRNVNQCEFCGDANPIKCSDRVVMSYCEKCFLRSLAQRQPGKTITGEQLRELFDSQNVCPYTGAQLTIGVNISIDHIVPTSQGGAHDISNIQFVYCNGAFDVNRMKGHMSHDEFVKAIHMMSTHLAEPFTE